MKKLPDFLLRKEEYQEFPSFRRTDISFINKTIEKIAGIIQLNSQQLYTSKRKLFLSKISTTTRLIVFFLYMLLVSFSSSIRFELFVGAVILLSNISTSCRLFTLYRRILFFTFLFGFVVALPSSLNVISKGEVIFPVFRLSRELDFWKYHIPQVIGFTVEGLKGMSLLTLRVFNSVSLSFLLINTTPFNDIIKGLKMFRIPDSFLMIITLTYLYIIILSNSVLESYLAMKARIIGRMKNKEVQQLIAGRITHIFKMSRRHFEKTYQAMLSRGYSGEVVLTDRENLSGLDYTVIVVAVGIGSFFFFL